MTSGISSVVEQSTHDSRFEGSNTDVEGTVGEKIRKNENVSITDLLFPSCMICIFQHHLREVQQV